MAGVGWTLLARSLVGAPVSYMKLKKITICLDFDGVIADSGAYKRKVASALIGERVPLCEVSGERVRAGESRISQSEWEIVKRKVYFDKGAINHIMSVKGSTIAIKRWLKGGHTVKVITARVGRVRADAVYWLKKRGISIPVIGVGPRRTKNPHLKNCDVFVDDDADRVSEAKDVVSKVFLFHWPYNDDRRGLRSIRSLKEI